MGVILVLGREDDFCCKLVRDRLDAAGRETVFLPENELFPGVDFLWEIRGGKSRGAVGFRSPAVEFDRIDGVLARFSGITTSPEDHQTPDGQYLNSEWHALARGYVHSLPCPVVNRLRSELWYKHRLTVPDIVSMLPTVKFRLPRTMVTTKYHDARAFFRLCHRRIRYSPLSVPSNHLIERDEDLEKLEPLSKTLPLALTEIIDGQTVQAFVVGNTAVFDGAYNEPAARLCLEAATALELSFCEFDLVKTPAGDWYCLGIQCSPYLYDCSEDTRSILADRLITVLSTRELRRAA
jgi:hypothetical protein